MNCLLKTNCVFFKAYHRLICIYKNSKVWSEPSDSGFPKPGIMPPIMAAYIIYSISCCPPPNPPAPIALSLNSTKLLFRSNVSGAMRHVMKYLVVISFISLIFASYFFIFATIWLSILSYALNK